MKLTTIVVPLDGSALAEAAVPVAVDLLGGRPGSTLVLVRAIDPRLPGADAVGAQREIVRTAEQYLAQVAARFERPGVSVKRAVWYGSPAAYANRRGLTSRPLSVGPAVESPSAVPAFPAAGMGRRCGGG